MGAPGTRSVSYAGPAVPIPDAADLSGSNPGHQLWRFAGERRHWQDL